MVTIPKGWSLIWERTPADKAYVVLHGTASVQHDHDEFAGSARASCRRDGDHQPRAPQRHGVAATELEVLHFTKEAVERLREHTAFRTAVEAALSRVATVRD